MVWKKELIGAILVEGAEDAVVGYKGLKFASKILPLDPTAKTFKSAFIYLGLVES